VTRLDSDVGRLLSELKELKTDDNTLVIVAGDNGSSFAPNSEIGKRFDQTMGGKLRGFKRSRYEGGSREAISLLRGQPKLGPLAWEDRLDTISEEHNTWMQTHAYAHSYYNTPGNSIPGNRIYLFGWDSTGKPLRSGDFKTP